MPREKSSFWSEFEEKTDQNGKKRFQCKHCGIEKAMNATRLLDHYNTCSVRLNSQVLNLSNSSNSTNNKKRKQAKINNYMQSISSEDQQELEFLLARAFYSTGIPFNTIDNEDFRIFLKKACPSFKIPTRQSLSVNLLDNDYKNIKAATKNVLNETPYFCLTSDGWSNINKEPLINYMITTPKPIFYKSVNTKEQSHNAENIAKGIENVMIEVGIDKFVAVITDNANNMKAAWRILKEKYPNKIFLGCWAHGINLWVKDIIKHDWANEILNMTKKLSLYFRNHQIPLAALRRVQKDKYGKEIGLSLPVETRWLSTYQCLDNIFKSKMAMMALLGEDIVLEHEIKVKILDDIFWANLKDLRDFLLPFIVFIQQLEQDDPYLSTAFINLRKIEIQIKNNTKIPSDFSIYAIQKAEYRWNEFLYNPAVLVAYRLDPRYNGELLNNQRWDDIIEEELIRLAGEENQNLVLEEYSEFIGRCGGFVKSYLWGDIKNKPINWWHLLEKRYPLISSIALKLLSIPATSAASERNWSTYKFIHSKLRNRLINDRAEKLVYIYWNLRILKELNVPLTIKELVKNGVTIENSEESESDDNVEILDDFEELLNEIDLEQELSE